MCSLCLSKHYFNEKVVRSKGRKTSTCKRDWVRLPLDFSQGAPPPCSLFCLSCAFFGTDLNSIESARLETGSVFKNGAPTTNPRAAAAGRASAARREGTGIADPAERDAHDRARAERDRGLLCALADGRAAVD